MARTGVARTPGALGLTGHWIIEAMATESEYPFTANQFNALLEEERQAIAAVAEYLTGSNVGVSDKDLSIALNLMREAEGCVPMEEAGDDVLASVRRKYGAVYQVGTALAEAELERRGLVRRKHFNFCVVIEPSYEDATHVVVVDYDKPTCYVHEWSNAWHLGFEGLGALASAVLSVKSTLVRRVGEFNRSDGI